jgi:hypothetical protein
MKTTWNAAAAARQPVQSWLTARADVVGGHCRRADRRDLQARASHVGVAGGRRSGDDVIGASGRFGGGRKDSQSREQARRD